MANENELAYNFGPSYSGAMRQRQVQSAGYDKLQADTASTNATTLDTLFKTDKARQELPFDLQIKEAEAYPKAEEAKLKKQQAIDALGKIKEADAIKMSEEFTTKTLDTMQLMHKALQMNYSTKDAMELSVASMAKAYPDKPEMVDKLRKSLAPYMNLDPNEASTMLSNAMGSIQHVGQMMKNPTFYQEMYKQNAESDRQGTKNQTDIDVANIRANADLKAAGIRASSGSDGASSPKLEGSLVSAIMARYKDDPVKMEAELNRLWKEGHPGSLDVAKTDAINPKQGGGVEFTQSQTKSAGQQPQPAGKAPPKLGEVRNGYTYTGGDPAKPSSWKK